MTQTTFRIGFPFDDRGRETAWEFAIVHAQTAKVFKKRWLDGGEKELRTANIDKTGAKKASEEGQGYVDKRGYYFYHVSDLQRDSVAPQRPAVPPTWTDYSDTAACALALTQDAFASDNPIVLVSCECGFTPDFRTPTLFSVSTRSDEDNAKSLEKKWRAVAQTDLPVIGLALLDSDAEILSDVLSGLESPFTFATLAALDYSMPRRAPASGPFLISLGQRELPALARALNIPSPVWSPPAAHHASRESSESTEAVPSGPTAASPRRETNALRSANRSHVAAAVFCLLGLFAITSVTLAAFAFFGQGHLAAPPLSAIGLVGSARPAKASCSEGNAAACLADGIAALTGSGGTVDTRRAAKLFEQACSAGDQAACSQLGMMLQKGIAVSVDPLRATTLFTAACAHDQPEACLRLGVIKQKGQGHGRDLRVASELYGKACDLGLPTGCSALGYLRQSGLGGQLDYAGAQVLLRKACDSNDSWGCMLLVSGKLDRYEDVALDSELAVRLKSMCLQGMGPACSTLAYVFERHGGDALKRASELYREGCEHGVPFACYSLGMFFDHGTGVQRDPLRATSLFEKAMQFIVTPENPLDFRDFRVLEALLLDGRGAPRDQNRIAIVSSDACEDGNLLACVFFAQLLDEGAGIPKDGKRAENLLVAGCKAKFNAACVQLGFHYSKTGLSENLKKAIKLFEHACSDLHDPTACVNMGVEYYRGSEVPKDVPRAENLFRFGCEKQVLSGCELLGRSLLTRDDAESHTEGTLRLRDACDLGSPSSCVVVAERIFEGVESLAGPSDALQFFQRACDWADEDGCVGLARCYMSGFGTQTDRVQGGAILDRACRVGFSAACVDLGVHLLAERGLAGTEASLQLFDKACAKGSMLGCADFGATLLNGKRAPRGDYLKALSASTKACDAGLQAGCVNLAVQYASGYGVPRDDRRAIKLVEPACAGGMARGCYVLGTLYLEGRGVKEDLAYASRLFEKICAGAIEPTNQPSDIQSLACVALGDMYATGTGVPQESDRATQLYEKSCEGAKRNASYSRPNAFVGCTLLGSQYDEGSVVERNTEKAQLLFKMACEHHEPYSCRIRAEHLAAPGPLQDRETANALFREAVTYAEPLCAFGLPLYCEQLSELYDRGLGVEKDKKRSAIFKQRACDLGYPCENK